MRDAATAAGVMDRHTEPSAMAVFQCGQARFDVIVFRDHPRRPRQRDRRARQNQTLQYIATLHGFSQ
jgi:hypothetical protein